MKRRSALFAVLGGVALTIALAAQGWTDQEASIRRFRLVWIDEPSEQATLVWESLAGSGVAGKVHYGPEDFGTDAARYPLEVTASGPVSYAGMANVTARMTGLEPDRIYFFVVAEGARTSPRFWFRTAPANANKKISFIAGGDSRNNRTQRQNANRLVAKLRPVAVLFGGDYTASGTKSEWAEWLDDWQLTITGDGRMIPIVATREITRDPMKS